MVNGDSRQLLTTSQVAVRWHVDIRTIQRWAAAGRFATAFRTAGKHAWRIPIEEVEAIEAEDKP